MIKPKRILAFLLTLTMVLSIFPTNIVFAENSSSAIFENGNGTAESPYEIDTISKLEQFRESVNSGNDYSGVYIKLTADIDMSGKYNDRGEVWEPIGQSKNIQFKGVFDGDGHKINEIYVNGETHQGLFGYVGDGGKISNLGVTGTVRGTGYYVGAVTGYNAGTIENCYNGGTVAGDNGEIGGVVGHNEKGTVIGCYNTGIVINGECVGGVVGFSEQGTIKSCYNSGNVLGLSHTGGIIGYFNCLNGETGSVVECYNTGTVKGDVRVGGLVGRNGATVERCYNTGIISGDGAYVGGLIGDNDNDNSVVQNCYNTGEVSGKEEYIGGVLGYNTGTIKNCYSIGAVSGTKEYIGGVIGYKSGVTPNPENCYYLEGTADGAVNGRDIASAKKLTAEEMRAAGSFNTWEFNTVWEMGGELINRPLLKANKEKVGASEQTPYMIYNITDLEKFAEAVNGGDSFEGKAVKLMANIDLGEKYGASIGEEGNKQKVSWSPIGDNTHAFNGTFDGGNNKITGMYINNTEGKYMGLFYRIGQNGVVKNLGVEGPGVTAGRVSGGIAALNEGTIEDCYNACNVTVTISHGGGIVGHNKGTIRRCYNKGDIACTSTEYMDGSIGGIAGISSFINNTFDDSPNSVIENCYNMGKISGRDCSWVGGIVGNNCAATMNCYNIGVVEGKRYVGGILGDNSSASVQENCFYPDTENLVMGNRDVNYIGKTAAADFASGAVAHKLQKAQPEDTETNQIPQVWGQNLTNTAAEGEASNKDEYPVLTDSADKQVNKVSFVQKEAESESGYKEFTAAYANKDCAVAKFPADKPTPVNKFIKWSQSESTDGEEFTASTIVSGDMTVYAVGDEVTVASNESDTVKLRKNKSVGEIDLKKFVKNKSGNEASNFSFKLSDGSALPNNLEFDESTGKISGTPTCDAGVYTVKFDVTNNNGISIMSVETSESGTETLTIKLDIGLDGEGTKTSPYIINNLAELEYFRDDVNSGNTYKDKYIKLADKLEGDVDYIDMSTKYNTTMGKSWTPIGYDSSDNKYTYPFKGTFDGNNKTIRGLYINTTSYVQGLFGYIYGATIKNLTVDGNVTAKYYSGGIVGYADRSKIENCCNNANVTTTSESENRTGGIAGYVTDSPYAISGCYNTGNISGAGKCIGGIVGKCDTGSNLKNCYNTGTVSATNSGGVTEIGGIVGRLWNSSLKNSYNVGTVAATSTATKVGGAVGNFFASNHDITSVYYLDTCAGENTAFDSTYEGTKEKTKENFASGEIAYLLQSAQTAEIEGDPIPQVWGQNLTNTAAEGEASNKDEYPILTESADKKVNKVSFKVTDTSSADGYKDYAVKYGNKGKAFGDNFPSSNFGDYKIVRWVLDKADINSAEFTKDTTVDGDMSVYGVKSEVTVEANVSKTIECNKNDTITIDLTKYVANMSGNADLTKIAFDIDDDNSTLSQDWIGDNSTETELKITPKKVGTYTLKVKVRNNGVSAAKVDIDMANKMLKGVSQPAEISDFTLTFNVDLEKKVENDQTTYLIYNLDDLEYFRDKVNGGKSYWKEYVRLADKLDGDVDYIDMSAKYNETMSKSWEPIGKNSASFEGAFDGNGKEIKGLYINTIDSHQGLFGYIENATIKNLTVNGSISGEKEYFGGIVGYADSSVIENCCNNASVHTEYSDKNYIGGIAGYLTDSQISGCYNTGNISGAGTDIGGIAGAVECNSKVKNCYNKGDISTTYTGTEARIGGIVGWLLDASSLKNSYNAGMVTAGKTATKVGGVVGRFGYGATIISAYYLDTCAGENTTFDTNTAGAKPKTEAEFASGEIAYLLQSTQTAENGGESIPQIWGQELNETDSTKNDKSPVLTDKANKKVYVIEFYENSNKTGLYAYTKYADSYMNNGDTVTFPDYTGTNSEYFYGWSRSGRKVEKTYTAKVSDFNDAGISRYNSLWNEVAFENIGGTKQTYLADTPREISFTPLLNGSTEGISADDFEVKYYEVDENKKELKSITAVNAVSAGKYLYVIGIKEGSTVKAYIKNSYTVSGTDLPDMNSSSALEYGNIGYMYITSGAESAQKPIYFEKQAVNAKMTDTVENNLVNPNANTEVTYTSSDESVAKVDNSGKVTIKGAGSTVIVATSTKENAADVYASYTLNVTKEVITVTANNKAISYGDDFANDGYTVSKDGITLNGTPVYTTDYNVGDGVGKYEINVSGLSSDLYEIEYKSGKLTVGAKELAAGDFEVTVKNKTYDGSNKAEVTAKVKEDSLVSGDVVTVLVSGTFDKQTVDASKVNYTITGLSGKDSSNYVVKNDISGNKEASINKAKVTVSIPSYTSYVYDGEGKSVSVSAYANGVYFDKFDITYNGEKTLPTDKGIYTVGINLTDSNYELDGEINATLEIKSAQQDVFSIEGISDSVTYGDKLTLQTAGATQDSSVSYEITSGSEFVTLNGSEITTNGIGTVTVKATSTKANYADKTATRTFDIKPKTISVTAEATNREYDGTKDVEVTLKPNGVLSGDSVIVEKTSATVATADVENNKTVFVSGLSIDNQNYQLSSNAVQTSVNITKKSISNITLTAENKVYDGTKDVTGYTVTIADSDIVNADKDFVTVTGTAQFNSENVKDANKVTLSNLVLSGTKSGNYELKVTSAEASAEITKATVNFEFGTLSYIYDGKAKTVPVTATVNGKAFDGYTVTYGGAKEQTNAGKYNVEISLTDSENHTSDYTSKKQLEITTADQSAMTITGLLGTIEYGKTFGLSAVGGSDEITATWESSDTSIAEVNQAGVVTIKGVDKEVTITATKAANDNFNKQTASVTFTPVKKSVTIKITNLTQVYDGNAKSVTIETAAENYTIKYFDENNAEVTNPTNAGTYYVEVNATGNYEGGQSAVLTIKKAKHNTDNISLTIPKNLVYGTTYDVTVNGYDGADGVITYTGTGLYGGQTDKPTNAGSYTATLTISNDNYETATVTKKFEIAKATLYAKPDNQSRKYGEQNPVFTIKYYSDEACENEVTNADVMIAPVMSTSATASSGTDKTYDIVATGGYAENYTFVYVNGTLTIGTATGGNFYISGGNANPYVGNKFTLTAYYNNEKPTVEWSSTDDKIATVDKDGNVEIVGTGDATITAKMKDSRFDSSLTATFKLTAARLPETQNAIIFDTPIVEKYANDDAFTIKPSNVSDGATVTYKSSNSDVASVDETTGEVTINKVGTVVITATATKFNCPDVYASYTLSVKKIPVTIKADDKTITYGESFVGTATFPENMSEEDFEGELQFSTRYAAGKDVDDYDVIPKGLTSDKYDISFEPGTITVTEKKLRAEDFDVLAESKDYDGTDEVKLSAKVKQGVLVGSDNLYVTINGAFTDINAGEGKEVRYSITGLSGKGFENYLLEGTEDLETFADINTCEVTFFVSEETVRNYNSSPQSVQISAMANGNVFDSGNYTVYYLPEDGEEKLTEPTAVGRYIVSVELNSEFASNYRIKDFEAVLIIEQDTELELIISGSNKNVTVGDEFRLSAVYGNDNADVKWTSSDENVAVIDEATGDVKIIGSGDVTIIAEMNDENYGGLRAEFNLTAEKKHITLSANAAELIKTYNGEEQYVKFSAGKIDLTDVSVETTYVMKNNPAVNVPKNVGTYAVSYKIDDNRYEGEGNLELVINRATVTVSAEPIVKEYGEEPEYKLNVSENVTGINAETMQELVTFTSDGADRTAKVGEYPINVELAIESDENCDYVINSEANGKLSVVKATLTVNVEDITRGYGEENPTELSYTIIGFKNDETEDILTGTISPIYAETIKEEMGTQKDVITAANMLENENYNVVVKYAEGEGADLIITKVQVKAKAGSARASYLTINLDKALEGLTPENFIVKNGEDTVEITSVTASGDNKTYTLNGTFTVGTTYTVTLQLTSNTHEIVSEPLTVTPSRSSSGGGGGGGGSAEPASYTVAFETNGGSKVNSIKVTKGNAVAEPKAPTKDGFVFDGWYSDKKLTKEYDFNTKVTKSITLYAKWTEEKVEIPDDKDDSKDNNEDNNKDDDKKPSVNAWINPFGDVSNADWFFDNIRYANENGLMSGMTNSTFAPNDTLTRGMLVTVLYRAEGEPEVNKSIPFNDVNASQYYADAVIWAEQNGIVNGVSETEFAPDENITREQIATIIYRYAEYKGIAPTGAWAIKLDYADTAEISDYAIEGVMYCTMKNIMQGKDNNMFAPKDNATRAEIAAILNRFIEGNK